MACSVTPLSWGGCLSSLLGKAASSAAGSAFTAVANYFADAAKSATAWLWNAMGQASAVQLGGPGWATDLGITVGLALVVGTGLFLVQVIASAARRDMGGMGRAVRGLFVAFLAGGAAVGITELLLEAADSIANGIMVAGTGSSTWANLGQQVTAISALTTLSPAVMLLLALVVVMASVIVWAALMTRKLLLIVSALFAPIVFAGSLGDITASWVRKWIEFTVALIASKVILVLIFVVGLGVLDNGVGEATVGGGTSGQAAQSATQLVIGCLILCLAGLAPWMAIKLVHFTGDSFHQIHSYSQAVQGAGQQVVAVPQKLTQHAQRFALGSAPSSSLKSPTPPRTDSSTETTPDAGGTEALTSAGPGGSELGGEAATGVGVVAAPLAGATAVKGAGQAGAAKLVEVGSGHPGSAASDDVGSSTAGNGLSPSGQLPQPRSEQSSSSVPPGPSQPG